MVRPGRPREGVVTLCPAGNSMKGTVLRCWTLKPTVDGGVGVEGYRQPSDDYWHSSTLVRRLAFRSMQTRSGNVYHLEGPIDRLRMKHHGFKDQVVAAFANGFPDDWMSCLTLGAKGSDDTDTGKLSIVKEERHSPPPAPPELPDSQDMIGHSPSELDHTSPPESMKSALVNTPPKPKRKIADRLVKATSPTVIIATKTSPESVKSAPVNTPHKPKRKVVDRLVKHTSPTVTKTTKTFTKTLRNRDIPVPCLFIKSKHDKRPSPLAKKDTKKPITTQSHTTNSTNSNSNRTNPTERESTAEKVVTKEEPGAGGLRRSSRKPLLSRTWWISDTHAVDPRNCTDYLGSFMSERTLKSEQLKRPSTHSPPKLHSKRLREDSSSPSPPPPVPRRRGRLPKHPPPPPDSPQDVPVEAEKGKGKGKSTTVQLQLPQSSTDGFMTPPAKTRGRPPKEEGRKPIDKDQDQENAWTTEELAKLQLARKMVSVGTPNYWTVVASYVATRTPQECHSQIHEERGTDSAKRLAKKPRTEEGHIAREVRREQLLCDLTTKPVGAGKKGRMMLRELVNLEASMRPENDDILATTPYKGIGPRACMLLTPSVAPTSVLPVATTGSLLLDPITPRTPPGGPDQSNGLITPFGKGGDRDAYIATRWGQRKWQLLGPKTRELGVDLAVQSMGVSRPKNSRTLANALGGQCREMFADWKSEDDLDSELDDEGMDKDDDNDLSYQDD